MARNLTLTEGTHDDLETVVNLVIHAFAYDETWRLLFKDVSPDDEHTALMSIYGKRLRMADVTIYVIKNEAGKLLAFTGLQWPWDIKPIPDDQKALARSTDPNRLPTPTPPKGFRMEVWPAQLETMIGTFRCGYEPEKDFHRRGTMVMPEVQKLGLGRRLTRHTNTIADEFGRRTFLGAWPISAKMFCSLGFEQVGMADAHLENFGGDKELGKTSFLVRHPATKYSANL